MRQTFFGSTTTLAVLMMAAALTLMPPRPALAQRVGVSAALPPQPLLARHGLERAWWSQATLNPRRDKVRYLTADEEIVYVQSDSGIITAFDAETGVRLWSIQLGLPDHPSFPVVSNAQHAFITAGQMLYAVDRFTGTLVWQVRLPHQPSASPGVDHLNLYVPTLEGSVFALDLATIRDLYVENRLPQWSHTAVAWRYKTRAEIPAAPISTGHVVMFGSLAGPVYIVTAEDRAVVLQFETFGNPISAPMAFAHNNLYFSLRDFSFMCLGLNGQIQWRFTTGAPVYLEPRVIGDDLYITPLRGGMFCLSARAGVQKWWQPRIAEFLAQSPSYVYATDDLGNLMILNRFNGAPLGALPVRNFNVRFANDRTDRLYLATEGGLVVCIRERGRDYPLYHRHPDLRPILPEFAPETPPAADPDFEPAPEDDNAF